KAQAHSMSRRRIRVLPDNQDPYLVERESKGAQDVRAGGQVPAPGRQLVAQEPSHLGDLRGGPADLDEFAQRAGGQCKPLANTTTVSAPACRSFEISWYSGDRAHP